jgi:hypothetical protein
MLKKILGVYDGPRPHWVGNGFPCARCSATATTAAP